MTKLQAIRWFMRYVTGEEIIIAKDRFNESNYAMDISNEVPRLKLPRNLNGPSDENDKLFRQDFVARCPMARGFSNITLSLLHESGHWATRSVMNVVEYAKQVCNTLTQEEYMNVPWERLATEWAICWLNCPCNRRVAKLFEKAYFGY